MSNELVVIKKENALTILSNKDSVKSLIDDVRDRVMSMEGGSLDTVTGRKAIKSNAFKATKAKTAINEEYIQPLIDQVTAKIQPDLDTIQSLKDNKKVLNAGLDQIRKDVNAEVTAIEDEIKRKEEEKRLAEEAEKLRLQVESDHEMALLLNDKFDRELAERLEEEARIEKERQAQLEKERLEREDRIAQEAKEKAEREAAEREAKIKLEAKRDAIAAEERARAQAEEAERQSKLAEEKAKRDAAEAAEKAKQAQIQAQKDEEARKAEELARREANNYHIGVIRKSAKESIMALGIDEETAKKLVLAIHNKKIANVTINY